MSARLDLDGLVASLLSLGDPRRAPDEVARLLGALRPPSLAQLPSRAHGYTRTRVVRTPEFEVLLLRWDRGARTPVHDHGGSECWFQPLIGAFDLVDYDEGLRCAGARGAVRSLDHQPGGAQIHRVAVSGGVPSALSLQLYAAPIERYRVYDLRRGTSRWLPADIDGELPLRRLVAQEGDHSLAG